MPWFRHGEVTNFENRAFCIHVKRMMLTKITDEHHMTVTYGRFLTVSKRNG